MTVENDLGDTLFGPPEGYAFRSRAVERTIEPGQVGNCAFEQCGEPIGYRARTTQRMVIANVYDDGQWQRVELFHRNCYGEFGQPYGEPIQGRVERLPLVELELE